MLASKGGVSQLGGNVYMELKMHCVTLFNSTTCYIVHFFAYLVHGTLFALALSYL